MRILAITASAIGAAFVLLIATLMLTAQPMDGEPYVYLDITDRTRGFDETIPLNSKTYDPRAPEIAISPVTESHWQTSLAGRATRRRFGQPRPIRTRFGGAIDRLDPVPVKALIEHTGYGPLPKIARDGRRPSDVYARPTALPPLGGPDNRKRIAILITDLGQSAIETQEAIKKLPGTVSLAFLPYSKNLQGWVRRARIDGHEIMLQIPMEPYDYPVNDPGPHTLLTDLSGKQNVGRLRWLMGRISGYMGVTNASGAKFTSSYEALKPIWKELKNRGLAYFDTANAARSPGEMLAGEVGLPYGAPEVVIDAEKNREDIDDALKKLEKLAKSRGLAVGVGSSLPITISRIQKWSKELAKKGIELVPLSAAIKARRRT